MKYRLLVFLFCFITIALSAQNISIGVRDNQYANIQYISKFHLLSELENSMFTTKIKLQHIRVYAGYRQDFKYLTGDVRVYYGTAYNNSYNDYGVKILGKKTFLKKWGIGLTLNPHNDSDYGYTTCYDVALYHYICKEIAVELTSSNIPEYRETINRIKAGLMFSSGNLHVKPQISIPTEGHVKNIRVLFSFNYQFQ